MYNRQRSGKLIHEATLKVEKEAPLRSAKTIIYDIGANNGDDIPYYLKKADVVVAVEANPQLCEQMRERFSSELQQGKLIIENCVLTSKEFGETVPFYVHKTAHVLSQFPPPISHPENFERVMLVGKSVRQLFSEYGLPHYVKIDIEGYDHVLLRSLFDNNIRPPYVSAESHDIEVFLLLVSLGGYRLFKMVYGRSVAQDYGHCRIKTAHGEEAYSFPHHSAGPFAEDITGEWINAGSLFRRLRAEGLGWKDIHAKREHAESQKRQIWNSTTWRLVYWYYKITWLAMRAYRTLKGTLLRVKAS